MAVSSETAISRAVGMPLADSGFAVQAVMAAVSAETHRSLAILQTRG